MSCPQPSPHAGVLRSPQVLAELRRVLGGRAPKYDDLPALQYTTQVVKEVLRLYPSIPLFPREVEKDDVLPTGHKIPAGDVSRRITSDTSKTSCQMWDPSWGDCTVLSSLFN